MTTMTGAGSMLPMTLLRTRCHPPRPQGRGWNRTARQDPPGVDSPRVAPDMGAVAPDMGAEAFGGIGYQTQMGTGVGAEAIGGRGYYWGSPH